jgi:predicted porin
MAAGLLVGEASAADPVKLGIGGFYYGAAGVVGGEEDGSHEPGDSRRPEVFKQEVEVHFKGETTLDNGLTVGARIELEGQSASDNGGQNGNKPFDGTDSSQDQIDEVWAFVRGGFGEFRFGDDSEALGQLCYLVPTASVMFGADSPFFNFSNAGDGNGYSSTNGTCYGIDDKSTKAMYFTPRFWGFQFAATYTPDNTEDSRNNEAGGAGGRPSNDAGQNSRVWSLAGNFVQDFNGFGVVVGGGYSSSDRERSAGSDDRQEVNAYANVSFAGFTIGGAYARRFNLSSSVDNIDAQVYGAGVTYNIDAWTVGFGWTHGDYDISSDDDTDRYDVFSLTGSYALGPGISIDAVAEYYDQNDDNNNTGGTSNSSTGNVATDVDYSAWAVGLGLAIGF